MALEFTREELLAAHGLNMDAILAKREAQPTYAPAPIDARAAASDWKRVVNSIQTWEPVQGEKHATVLLVLCLAVARRHQRHLLTHGHRQNLRSGAAP